MSSSVKYVVVQFVGSSTYFSFSSHPLVAVAFWHLQPPLSLLVRGISFPSSNPGPPGHPFSWCHFVRESGFPHSRGCLPLGEGVGEGGVDVRGRIVGGWLGISVGVVSRMDGERSCQGSRRGSPGMRLSESAP